MEDHKGRDEYFKGQEKLCAENDRISKDLFREFGVKAGLRDENGQGVLLFRRN